MDDIPDDEWQSWFEEILKKAAPIIAENVIKDSQRYGTPIIDISMDPDNPKHILRNPYTFEIIPEEDLGKPIPYPLPTRRPDVMPEVLRALKKF